MPPVVVTGDRPQQRSTAPSATTPSQRVEPSDTSYPPVSGARPIRTGELFDIPGENPGYFFNLATYGSDFGKSLASHGLYLHGNYQQSDLSVIGGGHKEISDYVGLGYWGLDLDTQKAFGLKGGYIDFTFTTQFGNTGAAENSTGSETFVPYGFGDNVRLLHLFYNQSFGDHTVQITVGRMTPTTGTPYLSPGFHSTQFYCVFFSNSCGPPNGFAFNASKAPYEVGSWGGFITYHPAPNWYMKTGVFENQPLLVTTSTHLGWPGRDWGLNEAAGAYLPAQIGYITTPANSLYPTNFHIGGFFDTAKYPDKYYNSRGLPAALFPGAPLLDNKSDGLFAAIQQTVLRFSDNPRSIRGLSLFLSGDWDVNGLETDQQQYEGGFILTGPFPSRAADTLNFYFSKQVFDPRQKAGRDALALARGIDYKQQDQLGFELNYGFTPAPGIVLYPYTQYIFHPDQLSLAVPDPKDTHAFTVGFRATVRFESLFGLPQFGY